MPMERRKARERFPRERREGRGRLFIRNQCNAAGAICPEKGRARSEKREKRRGDRGMEALFFLLQASASISLASVKSVSVKPPNEREEVQMRTTFQRISMSG